MGLRPPTRLRALQKPPSFPTSVWFCNASAGAPHWGGPAAGQFVTRGGSFLHKICETWRTLVKTSNPHINFALIASLYIKIHKFNEEKPVSHWNVCSGSGKGVNRRDGPQQGDRLDLEGMRSAPGKPQTGLFVFFASFLHKQQTPRHLARPSTTIFLGSTHSSGTSSICPARWTMPRQVNLIMTVTLNSQGLSNTFPQPRATLWQTQWSPIVPTVTSLSCLGQLSPSKPLQLAIII